MSTIDDEEAGLRTRKKLETRAALSAAALRLAQEHGLDNVRVDDIAAAANVSPRTYNNYFSSREQAICVALATERTLRAGAALRAITMDDRLEQALPRTIIDVYGEEPDTATVELVNSAPALRREYVQTLVAIDNRLAEVIAPRTGSDSLAPRVIAAAITNALRIAMEDWLAAETSVALTDLLSGCLAPLFPALHALDHNLPKGRR
ncbi:TetR family transcriptional regulator [Kribbella sp. NPDC006257]|uniref:TetR/AcrR family transcriptional regulator n=1 Tax=Kribbella sp. NPDC006257 TaxID=3156738 RepID=UPI0033BD1883